MKKNAWVTTIIQACNEMLYYFPLILLWNHFLVRAELAITLAGILICYLLGFALGRYNLVRYLEWLVCLMAAVIVSVAIGGFSYHSLALTILAIVAVLRGYRFRYTSWNELFNNNAYIISISVYFVVPIAFMFFPALKIYSPFLYWAGLYCIFHALFTFNYKQLEVASQNTKVGQTIAQNVLRANRFGISVVVIIIFMVINIDRLLQIVKAWLRGLFEWLNQFLSKPQTEEPIPLEPQLENVGGMNEPAGEPSALAKFLDLILYYAAYVIILLLAIVIVYLIIVKLLKPLISRLISTAKITRELQVGFSDEEEKLEAPKLGHWLRGLVERRQGQSEPQDNEGRVRYLYRKTLQTAIKKGYEFQKSQTPLEIERDLQALQSKLPLPSRLIDLYNKARYGESKITDEEIKGLKDGKD